MVDSNSLVATEIPRLLPAVSPSSFPVAMRCVAKDFGNVMVVAFVLEDAWSLVYYERGTEPDYHLLSEILPNCKHFNVLHNI